MEKAAMEMIVVCGGRRSVACVRNSYASRTIIDVHSTLTLAFRPNFKHMRRSHRPVNAALMVTVAAEYPAQARSDDDTCLKHRLPPHSDYGLFCFKGLGTNPLLCFHILPCAVTRPILR
jgi:hypothetical protein